MIFLFLRMLCDVSRCVIVLLIVTLARYAIALLLTATPGVAALEPPALLFTVTRTLAPGLLRALAVLRRF